MTFCSSRFFSKALLLTAFCGAGFGLCFVAAAQAQAAPPAPQAPGGRGPDGGPGGAPWAGMQPGTYTTVTGTISQFNYDQEAEIEGFLLSNGSLVQLPRGVAAKLVPSLHAGDNVTVAGMARTSPTGFQTITAQSIKDSTSGKSLE